MTDYVFGGRREDEVPRTTDARGPQEVSHAVARRLDLAPAVWGMLMVIASETVLFGSFIASYFYLRIHAPHWPPAGIPEPKLAVPVILAGVLATTSLPMQLGSRALRAGRLGAGRVFIGIALFVQSGYFAFEMHDFMDELHDFGPKSHAYGSIYYTLLGADHGHVFVGLLLNVWLLYKLVTGLTTYRLNAAQAIAWYWHFVNILTLLVIGTLESARVV